MLFKRQTSEPAGGSSAAVNITKLSPNVIEAPSPTSSPTSSNLFTNWYSKITANVKKRQTFSPKTLLKKALVNTLVYQQNSNLL